ncbi:unnamed protein product, partial [Didymodactylos carnosus]
NYFVNQLKTIEERYKSALDIFNMSIEQNDNKQNHFNLLNRLKEEIIQSLNYYNNISPKSEIRKKLNEIISSIDDLDTKFKQIISSNCFDINLEFKDIKEKQEFYQYLKENNTNDILIQLLLIIEDSLTQPKICLQDSI